MTVFPLPLATREGCHARSAIGHFAETVQDRRNVSLFGTNIDMASNAPKPRQLKPWPELTGVMPLLSAMDTSTKRRGGKVHLDLTNVYRVDALGLSILIARVAQTLASLNGELILSMPKEMAAHSLINSLGLLEHLGHLGLMPNTERSLFDEPVSDSVWPGEMQHQNRNDEDGLVERMISIVPASDGKRDEVIARIKSEVKQFLRRDQKRQFAHEQIMVVLLELVKNTIDHSGSPAMLGLRLCYDSNDRAHFSFIYCDTGPGICNSVRRHMEGLAASRADGLQPSEQIFRLGRLSQKGSFSDLIHWALQPGNSTKIGNGVNFGLGLMLIIEASKRCGFRLSVKDADSMVMLTELSSLNAKENSAPYSHAQIRQLGVAMCASPLLMFHGELET